MPDRAKKVRECKSCGTVWRTYITTPCDAPDCGECQLERSIGIFDGNHWEVGEDSYDEVVAYSCPHGTGYDWLCRSCGAKVGGWGVGAAGFGELCGCAA